MELAPTPWWSLRFWASPLCPLHRSPPVVNQHTELEHTPKPLPTGYNSRDSFHNWRTGDGRSGCTISGVCCNFLGRIVSTEERRTFYYFCLGWLIVWNEMEMLNPGRWYLLMKEPSPDHLMNMYSSLFTLKCWQGMTWLYIPAVAAFPPIDSSLWHLCGWGSRHILQDIYIYTYIYIHKYLSCTILYYVCIIF